MTAATASANPAAQFLPALDQTLHDVVLQMPAAPNFDRMVRYALGWVNADGTPYLQATGKRIRPQLVLLACGAAGGAWQTALPAAAAVELLHNFSLIHDDIQDRSDTRHARPTLWRVWGEANAINAGDATFALSYIALAMQAQRGTPAETTLKLWTIFNRTNLELTRGQHLDMAFETQETVALGDYVSMVSGKSAALLAACVQMGALIGLANAEDAGYSDRVAGHYADYGLNLGIAFQIHDDILGIWGDPAVTGKSAASDILARKKSLPVLFGLEQSAELRALYARPTLSGENVADAVRLLDDAGARDYTEAQERHYYETALAALEAAEPQGVYADLLYALNNALLRRNA